MANPFVDVPVDDPQMNTDPIVERLVIVRLIAFDDVVNNCAAAVEQLTTPVVILADGACSCARDISAPRPMGRFRGK